MDRGAWRAAVRGVVKSRTQQRDQHLSELLISMGPRNSLSVLIKKLSVPTACQALLLASQTQATYEEMENGLCY